jgi:hypothetical protein
MCCLQSFERVIVDFFRRSPLVTPRLDEESRMMTEHRRLSISIDPGSLCLSDTSGDSCLEDITFRCIHSRQQHPTIVPLELRE